MSSESNQGADRSEREPKSSRFSTNEIVAAGVAGAIILLIVVIIVSLVGHM
jgi:hypothetical protein